MTLAQLTYFVKVAELEHFTNAAKELYIAQPSLSYAIGELEKELGVALFHRRKNRVQLSRYGEIFLPYVKVALESINEGTDRLGNELSSLESTVVISSTPTVSGDVVEDALKDFYDREQTIELRFKIRSNNDAVIEDILSEQAELAITGNTHELVDTTYITRQEMFVLMSGKNPLAVRDFLTPEDIYNCRLIIDEQSSFMVNYTNELFKSFPKGARHVISTSDNVERSLLLTIGQDAITIGSKSIQMNYPNLVVKKLRGCRNWREIYIASLKNHRLSAAAEVVKNYIIDYYNKNGD